MKSLPFILIITLLGILNGVFALASAVLTRAAVHQDASLLKLLSEYPAATGAGELELLVTALHHAAEVGRLGNVRFLVRELKVDPGAESEDSFGGVILGISNDKQEQRQTLKAYTPMSRALEGGHHEVVRFLLDQGAKPTGRTRSGAPPVTFAVIHGKTEILKVLLENGADLEQLDFSGFTALHHAAAMNDGALVSLLLKHGADAKAKDPKGRTPPEQALEAEADEAVKLLSQ